MCGPCQVTITIECPSVSVHHRIWGVDFLSMVVSMPKQGGESGYCGDFNGDPDDDAEPVVPQWDRPIGKDLEPLPLVASLFPNDTAIALLGEEAFHTNKRSEEEEMKHKLKRINECPKVLLQKAEDACSGLTEAYHKFCVFDVCLSQNLASAQSVGAAAVIQHKLNARGVPVFMGHGRCLDSKGRSFMSYPTKLRTDTACQQVLRTLSLTDGVMGAQLKRGGICEVLTAKEVDPTNVAIPGGWGLPAKPTPEEDIQIKILPKEELQKVEERVEELQTPGDATGLIAATTNEASYNCWQLNWVAEVATLHEFWFVGVGFLSDCATTQGGSRSKLSYEAQNSASGTHREIQFQSAQSLYL